MASRCESRLGDAKAKELLALARARLSIRDLAVIGVLIALFVTLSIASPAFLTQRNLLNILDQNAAIGIMAIGATVVVIAGGLDLLDRGDLRPGRRSRGRHRE